MQSLLRWGIENSTPQDGTSVPTERKDLNPEIIDLLLGKSDAELMKEAMTVAVDANKSEDERIDALDNLEMVSQYVVGFDTNLTDVILQLIEQIDNANSKYLFPQKFLFPFTTIIRRSCKTQHVAAFARSFDIWTRFRYCPCCMGYWYCSSEQPRSSGCSKY